MNGKVLEEVLQLKYLGSTQTKDGTSLKEVKNQTGTWTLSHDKTTRTMKNKAIRFLTRIKLNKSLVLSIMFYGCESWTLTADLETRIQAFENKCVKRTNTYGNRWTSGTFIVNRQASQVVMTRPCLPSLYAAKNYTKGNR